MRFKPGSLVFFYYNTMFEPFKFFHYAVVKPAISTATFFCMDSIFASKTTCRYGELPAKRAEFIGL